MKSISVSEFKQNIRKYADLAKKEKIVVNEGAGKAFLVVPIEGVGDEDEEYNPMFVKRILEAKESAEKGNCTEINIDNIWESIG